MTRKAPAKWYPDPLHRHEYRYWDGARWTEHVASGGTPSIDPPSSAPPASATPVVSNAVGSWQQAEEFAAWHMRSLGFDDARTTNSGRDGGIDVRAREAVAQVKHQASLVGRPAVQKLRGAAHEIPWALFYAQSGYSDLAVAYANQSRVALFEYSPDGRVRAANNGARYLLNARGTETDPSVGGFKQFTEATDQGQEALDSATLEFSAATRLVLSKIPNVNARRRAKAFKNLDHEIALVDKVLATVDDAPLQLAELLKQCNAIRGAAERLRNMRV